MPVICRVAAFVSVAFLLGAISPPRALADQQTAPNVDSREAIITACSGLAEARTSPFPFPSERVARICECAARRLESNARIQQIARALPQSTPSAADAERSYFVSKLAAAALSCLADDLDKIAEDERQLAQPEVSLWLNTLSVSVPVVWPTASGSANPPIVLAPNQEEAKRGKRGCRKPEYPALALQRGVSGTVTMAFLVDLDGRVGRARVVRSSGDTPLHKLLDATALAYIGDCEFRPGTADGSPVRAWSKVQYVWKIE